MGFALMSYAHFGGSPAMTLTRLFLAATLLAFLFATAADAHRRPYHHKHDRFDVGDAIVGAAVLGGIIALASGGKKKNEREADPPAPPAPYPTGNGYPVSDGFPGNDRTWNGGGDYAYADADYERRLASERSAINACAEEAEALGGRYGAEARVDRILSVDSDQREYRVTGEVRIDDRRAPAIQTAGFSCFADEGQVTGFRFEEQVAARD
jgi:hypothetical protein